jgi:hypothetical protein
LKCVKLPGAKAITKFFTFQHTNNYNKKKLKLNITFALEELPYIGGAVMPSADQTIMPELS